MLAIFIPFAILISIIDIRTHRIPNKILLLAFSSLLLYGLYQGRGLSVANLVTCGWFFAVGLSLSLLGDMGAGDVKLLTIIGLFIVPPTGPGVSGFFAGFLGSITIHILIYLLRHRTLQGSFPLAPSLLLGAIWSAR
jgi:leader peptidase (prepilin peptidase)/N-methyltransferase